MPTFLSRNRCRSLWKAGVTAVGNHAKAVDVGFIKAVRHAVDAALKWQVGARMHQLRRLGLQDRLALILTVLEVRDHEPGHVIAGCCNATCGRGADELISVRLVFA